MTSAGYFTLILIAICIGLGAFLGFTRGLAGFTGAYLGMYFLRRMTVESSGKYLLIFIGIFVGCVIVGLLFYGATKFTPWEAFDNVFGAIFGFLMGWALCVFIFSYQVRFKPYSQMSKSVLCQQGETYDEDENRKKICNNGQEKGDSVAQYVYYVKPYTEMMNKTENLRNPDIKF